jgi:long-subunit acyl-CoA synthetase (AMP-forming)
LSAKLFRIEHVRARQFLDDEFTIACVEMAQKLKVKWKVVIDKYLDQVEEMHGGEPQS